MSDLEERLRICAARIRAKGMPLTARETLKFYGETCWYWDAEGDLDEPHLTRAFLAPNDEFLKDEGRKARIVLALMDEKQ